MKIVFYVISYGINKFNTRPQERSIHAERDAILGLRHRKSQKLKKVNLLVIKTSKTGHLGNSKPCYHCLQDMIKFAPARGYKIHHVFYTDTEGMIVKKKLSKMLAEGNFHFSSYYKNILQNKPVKNSYLSQCIVE